MQPELVVGRISSNPAVSHRIMGQYLVLIDLIDLDKPRKDELGSLMVEIIRKLESVAYHRDNLRQIVQARLEDSSPTEGITGVIVSDNSTGAEKEFEALVLQGKATLDVLVKMLRPLVGIELRTYANDGKTVLKALQNNVPETLRKRAEPLVELVARTVPWLEAWVGPYRDTVAHYKAIDSSGFVGVPAGDGKVRYSEPRDRRGNPLTAVADSLADDLVALCVEFFAFACAIRIPAALRLVLSNGRGNASGLPAKYVLALA